MVMVIETERLGTLRIPGFTGMLAMTGNGNRLVIPEEATAHFPDVECFKVVCEDDRIVLIPMRLPSADAVRDKLEAQGITDADVADAIAWARGYSQA